MRRWYHNFNIKFWLLWLCLAAVITIGTMPASNAWRMGDPDDQMRLLQIRDFLAGQSWFDVTQYRMNPPDGGPMHWSRLADIPLILAIAALTPLVGTAQAEWFAAILVPLLTFAGVSWLLASITRTLRNDTAALIAAALPVLSILLLMQLIPMRIDHHGWQMLLFLLCIRILLFAEDNKRDWLTMGGALAVWLLISIEGLPFALFFPGFLAAQWLLAHDDTALPAARRLVFTMLGMATGLVTLFLATRGLNDLSNHCDAISPFHIAAVVAAAGITVAARHFSGAAIGVRLATLAIGGAVSIGIIASSAPQCLTGAFAELDPVVHEYWYDRVGEGLPIWRIWGALWLSLPLLLFGLLGGLSLICASSEPTKQKGIVLLVAWAFAMIVGCLVMRALVYPLLLSCILGAIFMVRLFFHTESFSSPLLRTIPRMIAIIALFPNMPGVVVKNLYPPLREKVVANAILKPKMLHCQKASTAARLQKLPAAQLMAHLDASASILQFTDHRVVATGHHRNQMAMKDVILTFTGPPDAAREIFEKRKIDYLAVCPFAPELQMYRRRAPGGLWSQIAKGQKPDWLDKPIYFGGYKVWRYRKLEPAR